MWIGYETPLGRAWIEWDGDTLHRLGLPGAEAPAGDPVDTIPDWVASLRSGLVSYFGGVGRLPDVPFGISFPPTTPFRQAVYAAVRAIPYGSTRTYRDVGVAAGRPGAARAVGAAMADNPVAPLIPCHRVVGSDGGLRGYAGGLDMKQRLIDMEAGHA
jgi:methylated-DNA-[protein]-cysteine S-methyltransferase